MLIDDKEFVANSGPLYVYFGFQSEDIETHVRHVTNPIFDNNVRIAKHIIIHSKQPTISIIDLTGFDKVEHVEIFSDVEYYLYGLYKKFIRITAVHMPKNMNIDKTKMESRPIYVPNNGRLMMNVKISTEFLSQPKFNFQNISHSIRA